MIPQVNKFPCARRFTLEERVKTVLLTVLELLVEAAYTHNKTALLKQANVKLEVLRHVWRLAHEVNCSLSRPRRAPCGYELYRTSARPDLSCRLLCLSAEQGRLCRGGSEASVGADL